MLWLLGTFTVANYVFPRWACSPRCWSSSTWRRIGRTRMTMESAMAGLSTASSLGGMTGGVLISAWGGLKRQRVFGVLGGIMGVAGSVWRCWVFQTAVLAGGCSLFFVTAFVFRSPTPTRRPSGRRITPRELQGRVFAVRRVIAQFAGPFSTALAGVLGGLFNPGYVLAGMNIALVVFVSSSSLTLFC